MIVLAAALKAFGAEFFCFNFLTKPGQKFEDVILAIRVPPEWLRLYLERDFGSVDPSVRILSNTSTPLSIPLGSPRQPK